MPSSSVKKKISCSKEDLINMVLDIEKYPEFVPWCLDSKVYEKKDKGDTVEIIADLTIGKSFFKETYKSFVIYSKSADTIYVTSMEGSLKYLENKWFFKDLGEASQVEFQVDFELKNKMLNLFMNKSFDLGLIKIADAFQKRANDLFKKI